MNNPAHVGGEMTMEVGYVGLGAMGGALARQLLARRAIRVFDINPATVARFEEAGATGAATGADLARRCGLVLLCLPRSADVRSAVFGPGGLAEGMAEGTVLVDQTSGDPAVTAALAAELAAKGVAMLDAPVSGGVRGAEAGTITIMVSGPTDAYDKARPVLELISPNVEYCGSRVGEAQALKLVNNMMNAACRLATLEVVAMGRKMGLPLRTITEVLELGSGRNRMSRVFLPAMVAGKPPADFALSLMLKDVDLATGLGMRSGVPMPISGVVRSLLQAGVNTLGGQTRLDDISHMIGSMAGTTIAGD